MISGRAMPFSWRAHSRAAFTAIMMLSVPPVVIVPATSSSPWKSPAAMDTTSASMRRSEGKATGDRPFSAMNSP